MTYDQLKDLPLRDLLGLIEHTVQICKDMPMMPGSDHYSREMNAPLLVMIGDFEIRARFYTPEPMPTNTGFVGLPINSQPH